MRVRSRFFSGTGLLTALFLALMLPVAPSAYNIPALADEVMAHVEATAGVAVFGQVLPEGVVPYGDTLQMVRENEGGEERLATQTDVRNRWPDGSIRFAVVTARPTVSGEYILQRVRAGGRPAGGLPKGSFSGLGKTDLKSSESPPRTDRDPIRIAEVNFAVGEEQYEAFLTDEDFEEIPDPEHAWWMGIGDVLLAGTDEPIAYEVHFSKYPRDAGGNPLPGGLRVLFGFRVHISEENGEVTQGRLEVVAENTHDVQGAGQVNYDVTVKIFGEERFAKSGVQHPWLTRWRGVYDVVSGGETPEVSVVRPDLEPAFQARALPRYLTGIVPDEVDYPWPPEDFEILGKGRWHPSRPDCGGRGDLGLPYPDWTARAIINRRPEQDEFVIANGVQEGSWPEHVRDRTAREGDLLSLVSIDEMPNYWLDDRSRAYYEDPDRETYQGDLSQTGSLVTDRAHHPSTSYVPYLLTGERYLADELAYEANYLLLSTFQEPLYHAREGSEGLLKGDEDERAFTRGVVALVDAASGLPDAWREERAYFSEKVENNLRWLDEFSETAGPLGIAWRSETRGDPTYGDFEGRYLWVIPFPNMNHAYVVHHAHQRGFQGGRLWMEQAVRFFLRNANDPECRYLAAHYRLPIADIDPPMIGEPRYYEYEELREVYERLGEPDLAGVYGPDLRQVLLIAIEMGLEGAREAEADIFPRIAEDLAERPGWAQDVDS